MTAANLTQDQAAALVGLTTRRLRQLEAEGEGALRDLDGTYPARQFGEWIRGRIDAGSDKERLIRAQADIAEMDAAEQRREVVRLTDVLRHLENLLATFKALLMALPTIIAPQVAPPGRAAEVQAVLRDYIDKALNELADGVEQYAISRRALESVANPATAAKSNGESVGGSEPEAV